MRRLRIYPKNGAVVAERVIRGARDGEELVFEGRGGIAALRAADRGIRAAGREVGVYDPTEMLALVNEVTVGADHQRGQRRTFAEKSWQLLVHVGETHIHQHARAIAQENGANLGPNSRAVASQDEDGRRMQWFLYFA